VFLARDFYLPFVKIAQMVRTSPLDIISENLIKKNETIAIAESVTSGLLMADFSLARNTTGFFQGGVVAYNLGQKARQLGVNPILAEQTNSVSEEVARQMAVGIAHAFCCEWGISITGYAAPVPELKIMQCFAFFSFSYKGAAVLTERIETPEKNQQRVQRIYIDRILKAFAHQTGLL
jgi:PncC family amidohydrolase